jgi:hypothetical protein
MSQVAPATFVRYGELATQMASLANVDNALRSAQGSVAQTEAAIAQQRQALASQVAAQRRLEKRIHRNENPRFLHYFVLNRKDKVVRLKGEHAGNLQAQTSTKAATAESELALSRHQQQLAGVSEAVRTRDALASEQQRIFDAVVQAHPSARLQQIAANAAAQERAAAQEQGLAQHVQAVLGQLQQGLGMYARAQQMLEEARMLNARARVINRIEFQEGPEGEAEYRRLEQLERDNQLRRDQLINDSQRPASDAYVLLSAAFAAFPAEARARYPQLAAQIGQTPLPQLRRANQGATLLADALFGKIGAAFNNASSEGMIRDNEQVLQQCTAIVNQQVALINALLAGIQANVAAMATNQRTLADQAQQERVAIFEAVRQRVMAASQPLPQANAVLVADASVPVAAW